MKSRVVGIALAVAGLAFFAFYASTTIQRGAELSLFTPAMLAGVVASAFLFALNYPLAGRAWSTSLAAPEWPVDVRTASRIFCLSQLGKYVPGYVAQPLSRAQLAASAGIPVAESMRVMLYETLLSPVAAAVAAAIVFVVSLTAASSSAAHSTLFGSAAAGAAVAWLAIVVSANPLARFVERRLPERFRGIVPYTPPKRRLLAASSIYVVCHLLAGAGFALVAIAAKALPFADAALLAALFSLSWLAGFIAPGAPAGLGVREAFLVSTLGSQFPAAFVVSIVVAQRLATTLGDLLGFGLGIALQRRN